MMLLIYIPHGSDETRAMSDISSRTDLIYIPLGSDETLCPAIIKRRCKTIYIPHGSDETEAVIAFCSSRKAFISHMVQMKQIHNLQVAMGLRSLFISHMVQMKLLLFQAYKYLKNHLYPTWFRWNHLILHHFSRINANYIPHCSDETWRNKRFFILIF